MPTLRPFQIEDLARAALRDSALLSWEQGLGKSLAAIAWPIVKDARRTLIIAPGSLHHQITATAARFFRKTLRPLKTREDFFRLNLHKPHTGAPMFFLADFHALGLNGADEWHDTFGHKGQHRTSRDLLKERKAWCKKHRIPYDAIGCAKSIGEEHNGITCLWSPALARIAAAHDSFDCVVIDEGTRLQATESRMAASIRLLNPRYRLVLTGTPIKNRLESVFWLAGWSSGPYGRWPYSPTNEAREQFADTFLRTERFITREEILTARGEKSRNTTRRSNRICQIHRLWKTLAPAIIRRRKADCGEDIPQKIMKPIIVPPGLAQLAVYRYHLDNPPIRSRTGKAKLHRRVQVGMQLTMLRLAALCPQSPALAQANTGVSGPKQSWTEFTPKFHAVLNIIHECLNNGQQVIVGSPFQEFSNTLHSRLQEVGVSSLLLDGSVPPEERGQLAAEFKSRRYPVLIAGLKAMGEGHSFENCANLILPAYSWAYDENEQFIHRIWRLNSPGPVTIHPILTAGTIDQRIYEVFTEKSDAASLALDGRLFTEPQSEVDLEQLLADAIRIFRADAETIDEQTIVHEWDTRLSRILHHAEARFHEHSVAPSPDATAALKIPSPTQLSVDILRKHYAAGTYQQPTKESLRAKLSRLRRKK
jgi:SNF2 family DNA or RNA helicase